MFSINGVGPIVRLKEIILLLKFLTYPSSQRRTNLRPRTTFVYSHLHYICILKNFPDFPTICLLFKLSLQLTLNPTDIKTSEPWKCYFFSNDYCQQLSDCILDMCTLTSFSFFCSFLNAKKCTLKDFPLILILYFYTCRNSSWPIENGRNGTWK